MVYRNISLVDKNTRCSLFNKIDTLEWRLPTFSHVEKSGNISSSLSPLALYALYIGSLVQLVRIQRVDVC